ncbi:Adenine-specific DNA methylase [Mesorhizobium australicum]|uniref:site-specific DNA-methyltransferase (adenine-specific) n=2 Tax=Mesorhizobium australicum TaxID=536018 RepID=A0A1X7NEW9_9HYPH|nr:Adenine-specific DNA methylase [Mesorhizobium australicum]
MLGNGLGEALGRSLAEAERVLDLFTGSAAVAWYVAEQHGKEVLASDLQTYSTILAASVIERTKPIADRDWVESWMRRARGRVSAHRQWRDIKELQTSLDKIPVSEAASNARSIDFGTKFPVSKAYGGYYFSPWQAAWIDALRASMPEAEDLKSVGLAALIQAASRCAASPGHTAQPFKPNDTAGRFLIEAWQRDLPAIVRTRIDDIAPRKAGKKGRAYCMSANELAEAARPGDLVFLDPPYSGVHYSRFYHVLESVARGEVGEVSGSGRYPEKSERPISDFSMLTTSRRAFDDLLAILARKHANVIITFPAGKASNGLSGDDVKALATDHFRIEEAKVSSRFSTLGGDLKHRAARQDADELILTLSTRALY